MTQIFFQEKILEGKTIIEGMLSKTWTSCTTAMQWSEQNRSMTRFNLRYFQETPTVIKV